jgi:hypothetical protein
MRFFLQTYGCKFVMGITLAKYMAMLYRILILRLEKCTRPTASYRKCKHSVVVCCLVYYISLGSVEGKGLLQFNICVIQFPADERVLRTDRPRIEVLEGILRLLRIRARRP